MHQPLFISDGKVYDLPTQKGMQDIGADCNSQRNSFLLVTLNHVTNPATQAVETSRSFWLWNENEKEFVNYKYKNV